MTDQTIINLFIASCSITCLLGVFIIVQCFINILDWFQNKFKWKRISKSNIYHSNPFSIDKIYPPYPHQK